VGNQTAEVTSIDKILLTKILCKPMGAVNCLVTNIKISPVFNRRKKRLEQLEGNDNLHFWVNYPLNGTCNTQNPV